MGNDSANWIGYSNGMSYPVYKIREDDEKIGLCEIPGMLFLQWCTFEYIITNTNTK